MCFICDGGTEEQFHEEIAHHIRETGWFVYGVEHDDRGPGWAYTIGLSERYGHPELAVTGMCCFSCAGNMLNRAGRQVAAGRTLEIGEHLWLSPGALLVGAVHPDQWQGNRFSMWRRYYDDAGVEPPEAVALQLIWVDNEGVWQDQTRRWRRERLDQPPGAGRTSRTGGPATKHRRTHRRRSRR
jgi:hypothetical protein